MIPLTRLNYIKQSHSALYHSVTKAAAVILHVVSKLLAIASCIASGLALHPVSKLEIP